MTIQTREYRKVYDLGTSEYQIMLLIPRYIYRCNNKKMQCKKFTETIENVPNGSKFTTNVYNMIYEKITESCRDIQTILERDYSVEISFDQINEIKRKYICDNFKLLKKDKTELEKAINEEITGVAYSFNDPIDYIIDTVEKKYNLSESLSKYFKTEKTRKEKYNNLLILYSSIVSRMREQAAVSKYVYSLTSPVVLEKIRNTIFSKKPIENFNTNSFLRYLYKFDSKEIINNINGILSDMIDSNKISFDIHIVDATKIEVNQFVDYENKGKTQYNSEYKYGYKLTALYGVKTYGKGINEVDVLIPEEGYVTPINEHDLKVFKENIKCNHIKKGDYVIYDRGYTDLGLIKELDERGINVIVPARKNSEIFKDALNEIGVETINPYDEKNIDGIDYEGKKKVRDEIKKNIKWQNINTYDNSKSQEEVTIVKELEYIVPETKKEIKINACVFRFKIEYIKDETQEQYYHDNEYNYGVIYTNATKTSAEEIVKIYSKRMKIENMFRQMKQEWSLNKLLSKQYKYITMHLMSTLLANGVYQYFKTTNEGTEYRTNTIETTKEKLRRNLKGYEKTIISSKDYFEVYSMPEFLKLFQGLSKEKQDMIIRLSK